MAKNSVYVGFKVRVDVEDRGDHFAATTTPFSITVHGDTAEAAKERAYRAVDMLMHRHMKEDDSTEKTSSFLKARYVEHLVIEETPGEPPRRRMVGSETREVRFPVGGSGLNLVSGNAGI